MPVCHAFQLDCTNIANCRWSRTADGPGPWIRSHSLFHQNILYKESLHQTLASLSTKYGPCLYLRFGCRNLFVVSSPSTVEECFTKNDIIFANRPLSMAGDKLSFNYKIIIWAPYGYLWRALCRLFVNEIFSPNSLCKSFVLWSEEIGILIRGLFKDSNKNGSSRAKINLSNWEHTFVFNVMMRICTGKRCVSEEDTGTEKGKQIIEETRGFIFAALSLILNVSLIRWFDWGSLEIEENLDAYYDGRINLKKDKPFSFHSSESIYVM